MKLTSLLRLARKSKAGLTELSVTLGVAHTTTAQITTLYDDVLLKQVVYQSSKSGKADAFSALETARASVDEFLDTARAFLKPRLGSEWSDTWAQVGFLGPTLGLPGQDEDRVSTMQLLKTYFTAHPAHESADYDVTAVEAEDRLAAFLTAIQTTVDCAALQRTARDARRDSATALLKKLRALWNELESLLEDLDPRWLKFIDRIPGDPRVPDQVEEVTAEAQPGGIILVDWEDATRAASYKVLKQVVGVDAEPVLFTTVDDSDVEITGVPHGATVKLQIVATNAVGDAPASEVIQLQAA